MLMLYDVFYNLVYFSLLKKKKKRISLFFSAYNFVVVNAVVD